MKIRSGFVSNSSSSSFILAFDKKPQTWEEVYEAIFGEKFNSNKKQKIFQYSYDDTHENYWTGEEIAKDVLRAVEGAEQIKTIDEFFKKGEYGDSMLLSFHDFPREITGRCGIGYSTDERDAFYIKNGAVNNQEKIVDEFYKKFNRSIYNCDETDKKQVALQRKYFDAINDFYKQCNEIDEKYTKQIFAKFPFGKKVFFVISYADDDGQFGAMMEHEVVPKFKNCLQCVSNH